MFTVSTKSSEIVLHHCYTVHTTLPMFCIPLSTFKIKHNWFNLSGFLCVDKRWTSAWTPPGAQLCSNSLPVFQQQPINISGLGSSSLTETWTAGVQRSAGILSMLSRQINPETEMTKKTWNVTWRHTVDLKNNKLYNTVQGHLICGTCKAFICR